MNKLLIALVALSLVGCATSAPDDDPESVNSEGLAITVETAIDDIDEEEDGDVLMELELEDNDVTRAERLQTVKELLLAMAADEPCALRGVLGGRYEGVEDEDFDGVFGGRAYRGYETLVAVGEGSYIGYDDGEPGGTFEGAWSAFEGGEGLIDGTWDPSTVIEGIRLGTLDGTWAPADATHEGGNIAGLWHRTQDGRGLFLGYWSRCDAEPAGE